MRARSETLDLFYNQSRSLKQSMVLEVLGSSKRSTEVESEPIVIRRLFTTSNFCFSERSWGRTEKVQKDYCLTTGPKETQFFPKRLTII